MAAVCGITATSILFFTDNTATVHAASVSLNHTRYWLNKGSTFTLKLNNATGKTTFSSDNTAAATVNSSGVVTGKAQGTAHITAKNNGVSYSCQVRVRTVKNSWSYSNSSGTVNIRIKQYRDKRSDKYVDFWVADIYSDSKANLYKHLKTYTCGTTVTGAASGTKSRTALKMASNADAIIAVNGDNPGATYNDGLKPTYVIRNGSNRYQNLSSTFNVPGGEFNWAITALTKTGDMKHIWKNTYKDAAAAINAGVYQTWCFYGGQLVTDNKKVTSGTGRAPRTLIGQKTNGHIILVVADGRTSQSAGLSPKNSADLMWDLECKTATNLDGGGSSAMVYKGKILNNCTDPSRLLSDIVYAK